MRSERQVDADKCCQLSQDIFSSMVDLHRIHNVDQVFQYLLSYSVLSFKNSFHFLHDVNCRWDVLLMVALKPFNQLTIKSVVFYSDFSSLLLRYFSVFLNRVQSLLADDCVVFSANRWSQRSVIFQILYHSIKVIFLFVLSLVKITHRINHFFRTLFWSVEWSFHIWFSFFALLLTTCASHLMMFDRTIHNRILGVDVFFYFYLHSLHCLIQIGIESIF